MFKNLWNKDFNRSMLEKLDKTYSTELVLTNNALLEILAKIFTKY